MTGSGIKVESDGLIMKGKFQDGKIVNESKYYVLVSS